MMFDSQHNVGGNSSSGHHEGKTSTRGRKKKNAAGGTGAGSSSNANSKMYRAHQQQQFHHLSNPRQYQNQYGMQRGGYGPGGPMPPPSMMQPLRQSTGMGFGMPAEDENTDFILDDMDRLTSRDIAMARYRRNHELLSLVFDARRIDSLELPESPYARIDQSALKERLQEINEESDKLRREHETRTKRLKEDFAIQDARLHSVPKRARIGDNDSSKATADPVAEEEEVEEAEAWAKDPSKGQILGLGYIRTNTPEEVRAMLPRAPESIAVPVIATPQLAASAAETVTTKQDTMEETPVVSTMNAATNENTTTAEASSNAAVADSSMSLAADDTAMTGISLDGEGVSHAEVGGEDDAEEDEEDDEEAEGAEDNVDEEGAEEEGDGEHDDDADADADADGDGDADADADADADEDDVAEPQEPQLDLSASQDIDDQAQMEDSTVLEPMAAAADELPALADQQGESLSRDFALSERMPPEEIPEDALDTIMQDQTSAAEALEDSSEIPAAIGDVKARVGFIDDSSSQAVPLDSNEEPAQLEQAEPLVAEQSSALPLSESEELPSAAIPVAGELVEEQQQPIFE